MTATPAADPRTELAVLHLESFGNPRKFSRIARRTGRAIPVLHRVSRLADDIPQIAELDLNPAIARPDGVTVVDARIRVAPRHPRDPYLPQVR